MSNCYSRGDAGQSSGEPGTDSSITSGTKWFHLGDSETLGHGTITCRKQAKFNFIERPVKPPSFKRGIEGPTLRGVMGWDTG